ncbi:hypothetical protein AAG565_10415 [Fontimonas sp. SYSU GA230001]|uniref:hypothetical protein n=1 Tax=Fontimonas sp. SYSU GA230001 TaxID=3142450 RepID=UPI0032B339B7
MRPGVLIAAVLLVVVHPLAAGERSDREPPERSSIDMPEGWPAHSLIAADVGVIRFSDLGRLGDESATGSVARISTRLGIAGGSYLAIGGEYHWLTDTDPDLDFGYVRFGVGYQFRIDPSLDVGVELGAQGQIGKEFFGTDRVTEDAEYGRIWLRSALVGGATLWTTATLGSDYLGADLRCEWPTRWPALRVGLAAAAGRMERAEFWSVSPALRWSFGPGG